MHSFDALEPIVISNGYLTASFLRYGATLHDLRIVNHPYPLVLGYRNPIHYPENNGYFGAIVGRVANRISEGYFYLMVVSIKLIKMKIIKLVYMGDERVAMLWFGS